MEPSLTTGQMEPTNSSLGMNMPVWQELFSLGSELLIDPMNHTVDM